jgi:hypothetical protein
MLTLVAILTGMAPCATGLARAVEPDATVKDNGYATRAR